MANLETLELTINGSARSASDGISNLIASLSNLSNALVKPYSDLRDFNAELKKMKDYSMGFKLPNVSKSTGASGVSKGASRKTGEYPLAPEHQNGVNNIDVSKMKFPDAKPKERYEAELAKNIKAYRENLRMTREQNDAARKRVAQEKGMSDRMKGIFRSEMDARGEQAKTIVEQSTKVDLLRFKYDALKQSLIDGAREGKLSNKQLATGAIQLQKIEKDIYKAEHATDDNKSTIQKLKESFGGMFKEAEKGWSRIKRIATSMLIRSAIRGLIKSIKEGVNNLYGWSKLNNGEFAKSLDTLKAKSLQLKNSIGASIAPVIQAAIPVIQSLANAAITAFNWVNQLISLLTGKNSWTKATENVDAYADSVKGAGGAAKQWLASFDELNVMTSGGGGGGGGSSADYSNMFEEMYAFDGKIREIADFLKDNIESIKAMAIATGAAIAAWNISNAFAEVLPTLSKVAGLVGVGAVVAITLQAEWMLTNQYLSTGDEGWLIAGALTTALGTTIAYAMTKKILSGVAAKWSIPIMLAFSAVTDIVADIKRTDVSAFDEKSIKTRVVASLKAGGAAGVALAIAGASAGWVLVGALGGALVTFGVATLLKLGTEKTTITWGDVSLTQKEIEQFVLESDQFFVVNPKTTIELIDNNIKVSRDERDRIELELTELLGDMRVIELGINDKDTYKNLQNDVNAVVDSVGRYIEVAKETGKLTLQFTPTLVGDSSGEQANWFESYTAGWDMVNDFVAKKGKEIGNLLVENEKGEIIVKSPELLQTLMQQLSEVTNAIAEAKIGSQALANMRLGLGDLTKATGEQVITLFDEYKKQLEEQYTALVNEQYQKQGELVAALGIIDPNSEEYKKAKEAYIEMGRNLTKAVEDGVASQIEPGKDLVIEWLTKNHALGGVDVNLEPVYAEFGIDTVDGLKAAIESALEAGGFDGVELKALDTIKVYGWDFLSDELKKQIIGAIKVTPEIVETLKKQCKLSATEVINMTNWKSLEKRQQDELVKSIVNAYGASSIAALKSKLPEIKADEIVSVVDWTKFSNIEKLEFITAIKNAFGSETAKAAAKAAGINIGDLVQEGMKSKDDKIRKQAESWNGIIDTELTSDSHEIKVAAQQASLEGTCALINGTISALKPEVQPKMKSGSDTAIRDKVKSTVDGGTYTVSVGGGLKDGVTKGIQDSLDGRNYSITVTANYTELGKKIKNAVESIVATLNVKSDGTGKITFGGKRANGGFVNSGDLFIANENGTPEMIGRFGNHGAVANTDQIVAGITRGVAEANSEQNALLMQQNALLQAILQKDASVRLQASAALGRVASQSLNMYGAMVGV